MLSPGARCDSADVVEGTRERPFLHHAGPTATILALTGWMLLLAIAVVLVPTFRHMPSLDDAAIPPGVPGAELST